jgi:hypothetical protein
MKNDFEKIIEEKKATDKRQRKISTIILLICIAVILLIFYSVTKKQKANADLTQKLDSAKVIVSLKDSQTKKLSDTLSTIKKEIKKEIVECIGIPTGTKTANGLPKYNFTIRIKDSSIISSLNSVDYYFNDDTYNPKLKTSINSQNKFSIVIPNSWGCMPIVPVYLHYKNSTRDTILFPMCDKAKLDLPKI